VVHKVTVIDLRWRQATSLQDLISCTRQQTMLGSTQPDSSCGTEWHSV